MSREVWYLLRLENNSNKVINSIYGVSRKEAIEFFNESRVVTVNLNENGYEKIGPVTFTIAEGCNHMG